MKPSIEGVIFDVDGTLADTEEIHRQAFNLAFDQFELGWDWTPALYEELLRISGGRERITYYGADLRANFHSDAEFNNYVLNVHGVKTEIYRDLLHSGAIKLRPGVERLLDECRRANMILGIATASKYANLKTLLDQNLGTEWPTWFETIKTCDSVDEKKPSPAVYLAVLDSLPVPARRCLAFEDTVNGLKSATGAGICTIVTTHFFTRNHQFPEAGLVVNHLGDPDRPFQVAVGDAGDSQLVDLDLMNRVLEASHNANEDLANNISLASA